MHHGNSPVGKQDSVKFFSTPPMSMEGFEAIGETSTFLKTFVCECFGFGHVFE